MKEKIIISTISKIYFIIVSFFIFISLLFIVGFTVLANGLYLDNLSISNLNIKELSLRWQDGIRVAAKEITIEDQEENSIQKNSITLQEVQKETKLFLKFFPLIESLSIEELHFKNKSVTIKHTKSEGGFITMHSPAEDFSAKFTFLHTFIYLHELKYHDKTNQLSLNGKAIGSVTTNTLYIDTQLKLANDANISLYAVADAKKISFRLFANQPLHNINHLLSLVPMPKEINFWANRAIDAKSADIQELHGSFEYAKLSQAYKNIYAKIVLNRLNYTYNTKLDAIHTKTTELVYKNGILNIYPKNAFSYGMNLAKSWLYIDLTPKQEKLKLFLDFNAKLNKDILHILHTYKIDVPFLQKKGITKTDLQLLVDLRTIAIDAHGVFTTDKALFNYLGLDINIKNALIKLDNYDVTIPKMKAAYKNIAKADVKAHYNAKKSQGKIDFTFHKIGLEKKVSLLKRPLRASYTIAPNADALFVDDSLWSIDGYKLSLEPLAMRVDLENLQIKLPSVTFEVDSFAKGFVGGFYDIKQNRFSATVDLLSFQYEGIQSLSTDTLFRLKYDKELSIEAEDTISFMLNGTTYKVKKAIAKLNTQAFYVKHAQLSIGKYITTTLYAKHPFESKKSYITLNKFLLKEPKTDKTFYKNSKIHLIMVQKQKSLNIFSRELQADFFSTPQEWKLKLDSLGIIAKKSPFLQHYKLTKGDLELNKKSDETNIDIKGKIQYPYALLCTKEKDIYHYAFSGYLNKKQQLYLNINNKVDVKVANPIKISLHNSGINLNETIEFIKNLKNDTKTQTTTQLLLNAKNSFIKLGKDRFVLADSLKLQYFNDIVSAQLTHADGKAGFKLKGDSFHLYGYGFDDIFMQELFALSKFKGGELSFSVNGKLQHYDGIFFVSNTTMLDYALLNNILAFVNTIPSLATFSLPGYNKNGLFVKNAYMRFSTQDKIYTVSDFYINSKELKILGKGIVDLNTNRLDFTMNLKTDLGSGLSKVPLVGYILLDGKTISTTLKVTGPLNNPKVETMLAKDIAVAPLNIILRTLTLPYKLIDDATEKKK